MLFGDKDSEWNSNVILGFLFVILEEHGAFAVIRQSNI